MAKVKCAIIGSGNIGTDLMFKLERAPHLDLVALIGIDPESDGLARARERGYEAPANGIDWVRGNPDAVKTIQEIAFAAYTNHPHGMEAGLEATHYYDPPNLTYPFGSYICVVDIDKGTGQVTIRRFVAIDDCGNIINPKIVEGQVHGGLTMGLAPSLYEEISYDEAGNCLGGRCGYQLL